MFPYSVFGGDIIFIQMTTDPIRIAVAECLGWTDMEGVQGHDPSGVYGEAPNYPASLDACAEMEASLPTTGESIDYVKELGRIFMRDLNGKGTWEIRCIEDEDAVAHAIGYFVRATALQRCEAYLRVKGKWVD